MPPITIDSTTDTKEQVANAMGLKTEPVVEEKNQTSVPSQEETQENSESLDASEALEEKGEPEALDHSDDPETEDELEERPQKKKGGFKKRIDKLTKKASEAEQRALYWQNEALKYSQQKSAENVKPVDKAPVGEGKPNKDDYDTHEAYVEALTDWKVERKLEAERQKERESKIRNERDEKIKAHQKRLTDFVKAHDDFEDVINEVSDVRLSPTLEQVILDSENGPDIMYALAKDRKEYERINGLSPIQAARELGKLEVKLKANGSSEDPKPKLTPKPKPIEPVKSTASGAVKKSIYDPDLSQKEFERLRREAASRGA